MKRSHSASSRSRTGVVPPMPALLIRMSICPNSAMTEATIARMSASLVTSATIPTARRPVVVRMSAATASRSACVRLTSATSAPASARA